MIETILNVIGENNTQIACITFQFFLDGVKTQATNICCHQNALAKNNYIFLVMATGIGKQLEEIVNSY